MKKGRTAKRTSVKRKTSSAKKCRMSLREKELMALTIFAVFVFAFLLATTNVPQNKTGITGHVATNFIENMFANWTEGQLDVNVAKYLFFGILTLLVTSILSFAKFPRQGPLQFLIALPIAFLATAYITPQQVFTMLTSYTAMGVVLGSLFPFAIVLFFSAMLVSNERLNQMSIPKILMEVIVWIGFSAVEIYLLISGMVTGRVDWGLNFVFVGMVGISVASVLLVVFNSKFREWMWNIGNQLRVAKEKAIGTSEASHHKSREMVYGGGRPGSAIPQWTR